MLCIATVCICTEYLKGRKGIWGNVPEGGKVGERGGDGRNMKICH